MEYVLKAPVTELEVESVHTQISQVISQAWDTFNTEGGESALYHFVQDNGTPNNSSERPLYSSLKYKRSRPLEENVEEEKEVDEDEDVAQLMIKARQYQTAFFEHAKEHNTIVSLGTGTGKTLIALLLIRHFSKDFKDNQQTWFLVPSVALAVQQTQTLRYNLPYTVAAACHAAVGSDKARKELAESNIVVATHGSAIDLLRHYSDIFSLQRVNLLILDECHYAVKKHNYANLMRTFYHPLPKDDRPRVLGLTASPIINVKGNDSASNDQLELMLQDLETTLDAHLVSLSSIGMEGDRNSSGILSNNVKERVVYHHNNVTSQTFTPSHLFSNNLPEISQLIPSRRKELLQLSHLYDEYGPNLTGRYITTILKEVSRNKYEQETITQFDTFKKQMYKIKQLCVSECTGAVDGRSCKLMALEHILHEIFSISPSPQHIQPQDDEDEKVGIIFVERRVTALALQNYLRHFEHSEKENGIYKIRCDCLTRRNTHVFKYLHQSHQRNCGMQKDQEAYEEWLHVMKNIQTVLNKLRRREINLLISTSVVEEGVDVTHCSFVIVLDGIKTTKGYIQMKGRARSLNAQFFVFQDPNASSVVTLKQAIQTEQTIAAYIESRNKSHKLLSISPPPSKKLKLSPSFSKEAQALQHGEYCARYGRVDLLSAKSVVNRYASCVPMDLHSRSSREAMLPYQPLYDSSSNVLHLPSHLPPDIRTVHLLPEYVTNSKKKNEARLALMACVRLHEINVLNDRLLPLKRKDILDRLFASVLPPISPIEMKSNFDSSRVSYPPNSQYKSFYGYRLRQTGGLFQQHEIALNGPGNPLCILSPEPLSCPPQFHFHHIELETVDVDFVEIPLEITLSPYEWKLCMEFFSVLINARWRRRTGKLHFHPINDDKEEKEMECYNSLYRSIQQYVVVSMNSNGILHWDYMKQIIREYKRPLEDRQLAVQKWCCQQDNDRKPRLWAPLYDPNITYIAFNETIFTCASPFPEANINTYHQYYSEKRGFFLSKDCILWNVQRLWNLPRNLRDVIVEEGGQKKEEETIEEGEVNEDSNATDRCAGLVSVFLPHEACFEAPLADAALYLQCILMPQILYQFERHLQLELFVKYVSQHFPILSASLEPIPPMEIMIALTAKSCALDYSYDRLEFLGDAVLKLIHTDALVNSNEKKLNRWISCLHEGDLSALRSGMGCNERLKDACEKNGLTPFILTQPLGRGEWKPVGLESVYHLPDGGDNEKEDVRKNQRSQDSHLRIEPSIKVQADVIEAILGLVYLNHGYERCKQIAVELSISIAERKDSNNVSKLDSLHSCSKHKSKLIQSFLRKETFEQPSLLQEALTHASYIHSSVPSYQRLEWIGDAVLCLTAREWVYRTYPLLQVKDLVILETILVCNETLAFLGCSNGVHRYIEHCDSTLPTRLEQYEQLILENMIHQGIWSTDAPKVVADIVEALLGAVHSDGGFLQGQNSAKHVIEPITDTIRKNLESSSLRLCKAKAFEIMHPKQVMTELCEFLRVKSFREENFINDARSFVPYISTCLPPIWNGVSWIQYDLYKGGHGGIARVTWFGMYIFAVIDETSAAVAKNRACALISAVLQKNPDMLDKLVKMSKSLSLKMEKKVKSS